MDFDARYLDPSFVRREEEKIDELAVLIHNTIEDQGWKCYHPGVNLACCVGIARVILERRQYEPSWSR